MLRPSPAWAQGIAALNELLNCVYPPYAIWPNQHYFPGSKDKASSISLHLAKIQAFEKKTSTTSKIMFITSNDTEL